MKIIYFLSENLNRTSGGNVHFLAVAHGMKKLGHEVYVMAPQYFSTIRRPASLKMIPIPLPGRSVFTFVMYQLLSALLFPFIVLIHRPDALLLRAGGVGVVWPLELVARLLGVRVIVEINGISWSETEVRFGIPFLSGSVKLMASLECRIAHAIIAVTPRIIQELVRVTKLPPEKFTAIQNGANPDEFPGTGRDRMRKALGIEADAFVVGYTGQFAPWHGVLLLAKSAACIPPEVRRNIRIVMAGKGQSWQQTRKVVSDAGLKDVVRLPGWVSRQEVTDYLAAFDVGMVINCGWKEAQISGSPLKFWEYLAAGLPVIVSDDEDLSPFVRSEGMGIVMEDTLPRSIAAAIEEMFRRRDEFAEIGRRNRELVKQKYSWLEVAKKVTKVLAG